MHIIDVLWMNTICIAYLPELNVVITFSRYVILTGQSCCATLLLDERAKPFLYAQETRLIT